MNITEVALIVCTHTETKSTGFFANEVIMCTGQLRMVEVIATSEALKIIEQEVVLI
jgi:hypothetical protein